jgi:hypothetical protein
MIYISKGNMKLGKVANISLPPVLTCRKKVPCASQCYAKKSFRLWPNVKNAWAENLATYQAEPKTYFDEIDTWLFENKPSHFRWHVGGDCPDVEYLKGVIMTANIWPQIQFMIFTKQWEFLQRVGEIPKNLSVILSMWPKLRNPRKLTFPRAWLSSDPRKPKYYFKCPGKCDECYKCWELVKLGHDVVFDLH